jgi:hypothetical protein
MIALMMRDMKEQDPKWQPHDDLYKLCQFTG